jgi:hypothetical protein
VRIKTILRLLPNPELVDARFRPYVEDLLEAALREKLRGRSGVSRRGAAAAGGVPPL